MQLKWVCVIFPDIHEKGVDEETSSGLSMIKNVTNLKKRGGIIGSIKIKVTFREKTAKSLDTKCIDNQNDAQ